MRTFGVIAALALLANVSYVQAQGIENFPPCTADPTICQDDVLHIYFDAPTDVAKPGELKGAKKDDTFKLWVAGDIVTAKIGGFSLGIQHDPAFFDIPQSTITDQNDPNFCLSDGLTTCNPTVLGTDPIVEGADFVTETPDESKPYKGWIIAVVLTMTKKYKELPVGTTAAKLAGCNYKVVADPPAAGTKIYFSEALRPPPGLDGTPSPITEINLSTNNESKKPKTISNAMVYGLAQQTCGETKPFAFYFGAPDSTTAFDIAGAEVTKVVLRNNANVVGFSFGVALDKAARTLAFQEGLGPRQVALVVTKADMDEVTGTDLIGNSAKNAPADPAKITDIARADGLDQGDFEGFQVDTTDGLWATAGYVSDYKGVKVIPPVTDGATCGSKDIVKITIKAGVAPKHFSRGDGNGDGKLNITDGVIIAQKILLGTVKKYDCDLMLDVNDDGQLTTADPVFLLTYLFLNGNQPNDPFKKCGTEPTSTLACAQENCTP